MYRRLLIFLFLLLVYTLSIAQRGGRMYDALDGFDPDEPQLTFTENIISYVIFFGVLWLIFGNKKSGDNKK